MNIFLHNDAKEKYYLIINRARNRIKPKGYCEKHHVIPRSLGGSNKASNLVLLTAREHYRCHQLLVDMTKGEARSKMSYALFAMSRQASGVQSRYKPSAKEYAKARELARVSLSVARKGKSLEERYGKEKSDAIKAKLSKVHKGREFSKITRKNLSESKKGWNPSKETRQRMSDAQQARTWIRCKVCKQDIAPGTYHWTHGEKCATYRAKKKCIGCNKTCFILHTQQHCSDVCRRSNPKQKSSCIWITINRQRLSIPQAYERYGDKSLKYPTVFNRIVKLGWDPIEALTGKKVLPFANI